MAALDMALVLRARRALEGRIRRTPVEPSAELTEAAGVPVALKLECLQLTGSFKIRGAFFRLSELSDAERARGVVTCSALKETYRQVVGGAARGVKWVHLHGAPELIRRRIAERPGLFMKPVMLDSP